MAQTTLTLTVYFEDPFWVGVFERVEDDQLSVCRHVFGAEPTNAEVLAFVQQRFRKLAFSPAVAADRQMHHSNPKRRQRAARKASASRGIGTKAQQALAAQHEANKSQPQRFSAQSPRRSTGRTLRQTPRQTKSQTPWALANRGCHTNDGFRSCDSPIFVLNFAINCP